MSFPATGSGATLLYCQQRLTYAPRCREKALRRAIAAHARLAAEPAALILLMDSPQPAQLADQLGAVATLSLLFTLQGSSAPCNRAAGRWRADRRDNYKAKAQVGIIGSQQLHA